MNIPRRWLLAVAGVLLVAGCSTPDDASPAPRTTPSTEQSTERPAKTTTTPAAADSAFCLDLTTFESALLSYKAGAGNAIDGEPLDFETLKRGAAYVAELGEPMLPSAPPEIADHFRTVLTAVATSASNLKEGGAVLDVVDPLYGEQNRAAFEAVDTYDGCVP